MTIIGFFLNQSNSSWKKTDFNFLMGKLLINFAKKKCLAHPVEKEEKC